LYLNGKEEPKSDPMFGKDWYSADLFVNWGLKFIDEARAEKKPFFLYIAQGAAHFPLRAPREIIDKYPATYRAGWDKLREERYRRQIEMGLVDAGWPLAPRPADVPTWESRTADRQDRFVQMMATYAAMIDRIDHAMGTLVAGLKERGVYENTLILFLSDNGGNAEGGPPGITDGQGPIGGPQSRVFLGMNWATLCNTPFARYKHFTHEGGIATPLIAHWPAGIAEARRGKFETQPGHLIDVMATCVDMAGASYPREYKGSAILQMEGVSLRPAFAADGAGVARPAPNTAGQTLGRKQPIFWEHEGNKAVRDGKWKLVQRHKQSWQLFDMEADRTEQRDLIKEQPELAKKMESAWTTWAERTYVDPWPGPDHTDWGADIRPTP
jgi:arylsulfatase